MAFRGNESPMDFKWDKTPQLDPTSPFTMAGQKRSHAAFNSPGKNNFPALRSSHGNPHFSSKAASGSAYKADSFTTPRKNFDVEFSSPPDSSPRARTENEDTPDGKPLPATPFEFKSKPQKRNSMVKWLGRWGTSSGKGEIKKPLVIDTASKRVHKKRRQAQTFERQLALARKESEPESDSGADTPANKNRIQDRNKDLPPPPPKTGMMTNLFNFIHTYPDAPSIIAKYLQVFFNAAILFGCLYMFYSFYATIRSDVDRASDVAMAELLSESIACKNNFVKNGCGLPNLAPALEQVCANWELCMERDVSSVRRARLSAHAFAEIFNSFVEPISLKTMVFTTLVVGLALLINNATFTLYRRNLDHQHQEGYRQGSAYYGGQPHPSQYAITPGLPYQTPQQYVEWTPGHGQGGQGQLDYDQTPSRKRGASRSPEKKRLMLEN